MGSESLGIEELACLSSSESVWGPVGEGDLLTNMCVQRKTMSSAGMPGEFLCPSCLFYPISLQDVERRTEIAGSTAKAKEKGGRQKLMRYSTRTLEERHEGSFSDGLGGSDTEY